MIKPCKDKLCQSSPVFYKSPDGEKIIGCCGNARCKTRHKPPVSGYNEVAAINAWNAEYGSKL